MSNISDIANVKISIESPAAESASFSKMCLIADAPASATASNKDFLEISSAGDLTEYGYLTTDPIYSAARIAFSQEPRPDTIFVAEIQTVTEDDETSDEAISVTLDRANAAGSWYGFHIVKETIPAAGILSEAAAWADANEKLFVFSWTTGDCPITISSFARTGAIYGGSTASQTPNPFIGVAFMAKNFGYEAGSETWAHKTLVGVEASVLSTSDVTTFKSINANFYQKYANRTVTLDGKVGSGEWIDVIRFRDWLINEIRTRMVDLFAVNPKIAYTDDGITCVQGVLDSILKAAQDRGGIAPSTFDDDGNETPGYTITVPRAKDISNTQKSTRRLTGVKFTAKIAGAIHYTDIVGELVY